MGNTGKILSVISCVMIAVFGCRRENVAPPTSDKAVDAGEIRLQEAFCAVSDWRIFRPRGGLDRYRDATSVIRDELRRIGDPARRKKLINRYGEIVFSYPIDATDPSTRKEQLLAFREMSRSAAGRAQVFDEVETEWDIDLRCLKRMKDELKKLEAYLDGQGAPNEFEGDRKDWEAYHEYLKDLIASMDNALSRHFGVLRTAIFLDYEKWKAIREQLEELLGHKVEVWRPVLEHWERGRQKKPKKRQVADARPPYEWYDRILRGVLFIDPGLTVHMFPKCRRCNCGAPR